MSNNEVVPTETKLAIQSDSPLMPLMELAIKQDAGIEKLERLFALYEKDQEMKARKAYAESMTKYKKNAPFIVQDKKVKYKEVDYTYATLGNILNVLTKDLADYGFTIDWKTESAEKIKVECSCLHVEGHKESTSLTASADNSGSKNGIQAMGSTIKYLKRYTLLLLLGLDTNEHEDDGRGYIEKYERISRQQESVIDEWIAKFDNQENLLKLCSKKSGFEITKVSDIPALAFDSIIKMYQEKEKNKVE